VLAVALFFGVQALPLPPRSGLVRNLLTLRLSPELFFFHIVFGGTFVVSLPAASFRPGADSRRDFSTAAPT